MPAHFSHDGFALLWQRVCPAVVDATVRGHVDRLWSLDSVRFLSCRPLPFTRANTLPDTCTRTCSNANAIPQSNASAESHAHAATYACCDLYVDRRRARCCRTERDR
jgi:hypothetical protein